jgi:hypothetical protein
VRGYGHTAVAMTLGLYSTWDTGAKAVFERDGDEYILRNVWIGGGVGNELLLPRGRGERPRSAQESGAAEQVIIPAF